MFVCVDYCTENSHVVSVQTSEEATKNGRSFGPEKMFCKVAVQLSVVWAVTQSCWKSLYSCFLLIEIEKMV